MPKDMREIMREAQSDQLELPKGHRKRFEDKLTTLHKPKKTTSFFFLKVAAALAIVFSLGYLAFNGLATGTTVDSEEGPDVKFTSLSSVSPEMEKVENYYKAAISYELAGLEKTPENQKILDDYLEKIGKLDRDYERLTKELAEKGINEKTINSLITNLQLQLQLLLQLKDELNDLQTRKDIKNEDTTI